MVETMAGLDALIRRIRTEPRTRVLGRVARVVGLAVEVAGLRDVPLGEVCAIEPRGSSRGKIYCEVVGFHPDGTYVMPYGDMSGVHPGAPVRPLGHAAMAFVGDRLLGRVVDAMGKPIDGLAPISGLTPRPLVEVPPSPLARKRISEPLETGVRAIDGLITIGRGQRIGIFAAAGVGKSVLLGMIARRARSDVNVIALLGERGREVREFIERDLGPEGLARSVVIVATGDEGALLRARGALYATTVAEYFRDQGLDVALMVDSVTRVAMAWREIGLAVGEPPATRGYPPSVFAQLPRLLERAGMGSRGSITGFYTVLVEGDDMNEPVSDSVRSVLDGHIVLSSRLSAAAHFPAIDILQSKSRVRDEVISAEHRTHAETLLRVEATYREYEDIIAVGQYRQGAHPDVDAALACRDAILSFLRQRPDEFSSLEDTRKRLEALHQAILSVRNQKR